MNNKDSNEESANCYFVRDDDSIRKVERRLNNYSLLFLFIK